MKKRNKNSPIEEDFDEEINLERHAESSDTCTHWKVIKQFIKTQERSLFILCDSVKKTTPETQSK